MLKRILFTILSCTVLTMAVAPAGVFARPMGGDGGNSFEAVPKNHQGYVPSAPTEKVKDSAGKKALKGVGNMIGNMFGKLFDLMSNVVRFVISGNLDGKGVSLSDVIFGKINPINHKAFGKNNVGHIFSAAEWNKAVNPLRISFTFVAWVFLAVMVAWYGIKLMGESTNPLKRSNLQEQVYAWIGAGAMLAFMYLVVFIIFNLNYAIVHGLWQLIGGNDNTKDIFKVLEKGGDGLTGQGFADGLISLAMSVMTLVLIIQYVFRKFVIAVLVVISPLAAVAFAKNKDGMAFKLWISELMSQVFIQSAHAIVIVLYLAFLNASLDGGNGLFGYLGAMEGGVAGIINPILKFLISIGGVVAVGALIWNGIRLSMSSGNPQARALSLKGIQYSLIGCLVCVGSVMVVNIIRGLMF